VGFQDIKYYSEYVGKSADSVHIPRNGNMNRGQLLNFSNQILKIIYGKNAPESNHNNISSAMLQLRNFTEYGALANNQKYGLDAKDKFGFYLQQLIAKNGYTDSTASQMKNAANSGGLIGMWNDKFGDEKLKNK
ncbi:hypothetical protein LR004_02635, partial [Candidatus Gracilibacteria bacterium]|nr:hypothetical protein [Candidatus Gracilibacteria bacterium]